MFSVAPCRTACSGSGSRRRRRRHPDAGVVRLRCSSRGPGRSRPARRPTWLSETCSPAWDRRPRSRSGCGARLAVGDVEGRGPHPAAFGHGVRHHRALVVHHAGGRDLYGRHVEHHVRLAQRPFRRLELDLAPAGPRPRRAARRRRSSGPGSSSASGVRRSSSWKCAHRLVGLVGRHAVGADHLADHRREALDLLVVVQRQRADAARLVAGDALGLEDRGDGLGVGDLA